MDKKKNTINVYATSQGAELNISAPSTKQIINATNNKAQYFSEQAKKYRDEAKSHRDSAKYYAEQNSDVTHDYVENVRQSLISMIESKQNMGDYALKEELPKNLSELNNDVEYINQDVLSETLEEIKLPPQEGLSGSVLMTDGENESWIDLKALTTSDTTGCILEKPNRIKYTFQDNVLIIKAGSVFILPNGKDNFEYITLEDDYIISAALNNTDVGILSYRKNLKSFAVRRLTSQSGSGESIPTTGYWIFYNSLENKVYDISSGTVIDDECSFPIMTLGYTDGILSSVNQVFDGIGYIGATVWCDKDIKALIPNGRNQDGKLSNIEIITDKVLTNDIFNNSQKNVEARLTYLDGNLSLERNTQGVNIGYDANRNLYIRPDGAFRNSTVIAKADTDTSKITSFTSTNSFMGLDYNDLALGQNFKTVVKNYSNGSAWYRIWSDGWIEQGGIISIPNFTTSAEKTINLLLPYSNTNYSCYTQLMSGSTNWAWVQSCNVKEKSTTSFSLGFYGTSTGSIAAHKRQWFACGY